MMNLNSTRNSIDSVEQLYLSKEFVGKIVVVRHDEACKIYGSVCNPFTLQHYRSKSLRGDRFNPKGNDSSDSDLEILNALHEDSKSGVFGGHWEIPAESGQIKRGAAAFSNGKEIYIASVSGQFGPVTRKLIRQALKGTPAANLKVIFADYIENK